MGKTACWTREQRRGGYASEYDATRRYSARPHVRDRAQYAWNPTRRGGHRPTHPLRSRDHNAEPRTRACEFAASDNLHTLREYKHHAQLTEGGCRVRPPQLA